MHQQIVRLHGFRETPPLVRVGAGCVVLLTFSLLSLHPPLSALNRVGRLGGNLSFLFVTIRDG